MDLSEPHKLSAPETAKYLGISTSTLSSACLQVVHHFSNLDVVWSTTRAIWMIGRLRWRLRCVEFGATASRRSATANSAVSDRHN